MQTAATEHGSRRRLLLTLGVLTAFAPVSMDFYLPAFPDVAASLGTDIGSVQLTLSACLLGLGVGQLVYGPLSDRFGRRGPLTFGLVVFIVASLLCGLATSLPMLVALRVVQALGGCAGIVLARAIARDLFDRRQLTRALTAMSLVASTTPIIAPSAGALALRFMGWRWLFVLLAVFGVACLVASFTLPESLPAERRVSHGLGQTMRTYRHIARRADFIIPAMISALCSVTLFAYVSSGPAVVMEWYGASPTVFGVLFGCVGVCIIVGTRLNMRLLRTRATRWLLRRFLVVQVTATALALAAVLLRLPLLAVMVPLAVAVGCVGAITSNALAEALMPFARSAGSAAALAGFLQLTLGAFTAATLAVTSWAAPVEMTGVMLSAATIGLVLAWRVVPGTAQQATR